MADEDEIDILGDFSFNSCLAQNNQGIPSCSNREDTVHPQWLQDSVSTNWYDIQNRNRHSDGPSRKLSGNTPREKTHKIENSTWSLAERELLSREMAKYGRNIRKISQTLKTKTEAEIQALIDAEYGVHLDTPSFGLERDDDEGTPTVVQEEIVTEDIPNVLNMVTTGSPTVSIPKRPYRKRIVNVNTKVLSKLKSETNIISEKNLSDNVTINSEIFYEDDLIIGSTELIGSEVDNTDIIYHKMARQQKEKVKATKKYNHRRKVSRNFDRGKRNRSKELLKSPPGRQRKDSSLSEGSKSPKMKIVLGSGLALSVSEGEQVIKIEKKKDSEPESDIEVDIDSDSERPKPREPRVEEPIAVPLNFAPMGKRKKKLNLDAMGMGGCTIMHTAGGDVVRRVGEPRPPRRNKPPPHPPRPSPVPLVPCRTYGPDRPAPYEVQLHVSALLSMDLHAHCSRGEVMGLAGGTASHRRVTLSCYRPAKANSALEHCDMDPVSQLEAAAHLSSLDLQLLAWVHSHPRWGAWPSQRDLLQQRALQRLGRPAGPPPLAIITSQHWPVGRAASHYRCIRVEDDDSDSEDPIGYQLSVKLVADITQENLPALLNDLREVVTVETGELTNDMSRDVCPEAQLTYEDKFISSASHHLRSAGYEDHDPIVKDLIQGIRDIFR